MVTRARKLNMKRLLYTSTEVRQAIIRLFGSSNRRRVAITAFVGDGAEAYLPKPKGLELICWPKAGGTNPNVLRKLMKRGVAVSFADALHMKVYWSENRGAVITSANLSTNALGSGNLKEVGVLLAPGELDIDRLIQSLTIRPVSGRELRKLDRSHKLHIIRNRTRIKTDSTKDSYGKWYELPSRPEWKLGWWDSIGALASTAKKISKIEYEVDEPDNFIAARYRDYTKGDWILTFKLKKSPTGLDWMFADYVVTIPESDEKAYDPEYPYQAMQIWPGKYYPAPPFKLDKQFQEAFSKAIDEFGSSRIKKLKSSKPPKRFIDLIYGNWQCKRAI